MMSSRASFSNSVPLIRLLRLVDVSGMVFTVVIFQRLLRDMGAARPWRKAKQQLVFIEILRGFIAIFVIGFERRRAGRRCARTRVNYEQVRAL
jgi:hypothetical protein